MILRLVCGGCFLYLAWDLRSAVQDNVLYLAAVLGFGAVGLVLTAHSLWKLMRKERRAGPEENAE